MPLPEFGFNIETMNKALSVLTSMITPALFISATGTYILATSTRLSRVVDRMRALSEKIEHACAPTTIETPFQADYLALWRAQLRRQTERLKLLQTSLTMLYTAASSFICTSVAIGIIYILELKTFFIPVVLGMSGAGMLLIASIFLILEARKAVVNAEDEMILALRIADQRSPMPPST